ncbi:DUF6915 family protein [Raineya sp.]|jgi:hypothetical protein
MNIWEHCLLSARKFGGEPQDYQAVHSFLDSSKYFFYHIKHRLLLHHLLGIEWAVTTLGNFIQNTNGRVILVRDVAVEHFREDLDGTIPTLYEWLEKDENLQKFFPQLPEIDDEALAKFVHLPYHRTGLLGSYTITFSDFGVYLCEKILGFAKADLLRQLVPPSYKVKDMLKNYQFSERWQYNPQKQEILWLRQKLS